MTLSDKLKELGLWDNKPKEAMELKLEIIVGIREFIKGLKEFIDKNALCHDDCEHYNEMDDNLELTGAKHDLVIMSDLLEAIDKLAGDKLV